MKVWLALAGLVCVVGGQYTGRRYDETHAASTQYRVVEPTQNSGSDNGHVSSGISSLATLPTAFPFVVSPPHAVPHSTLLSTGGVLPTHVQAEQYDTNPQYSYSYGVHDPSNGDVKGHSETRRGDVVSGSYSVMEADGTMRIVDYTADSIHGFNAVIRNTPVHGQDYVPTSIPHQTNAVFPQRTQPVYLYRQASVYPSAPVNTHNQQLAYAPSAQLVSPSNDISYVITYQTPSSGNSPQYTLEHSNNAFTLQQSVNPTHTLPQSNAQNYNIRTTPQTNQNQQGSYYHFRMSSNSQQSTNPQQQSVAQITHTNQSQNTNRSSMSNRHLSTIGQNSLGLISFANQRNMNDNQRSSTTADYQRSHPTVTAYPTATPAYRY